MMVVNQTIQAHTVVVLNVVSSFTVHETCCMQNTKMNSAYMMLYVVHVGLQYMYLWRWTYMNKVGV